MLVLGIETSCDETGIALYETQSGLLAHTLYSQVELHSEYGGIVPELASRDHVRKVLPLVREVLAKANCALTDLDGIAYTCGPGLIGALLVGAMMAKSMGYALNIPTLGIHHLEGHLLAVMLEEKKPEFPFIALLVSGGHTLLVKVQAIGQYTILGETLDDAVGEAFDKTAKLLGLSYPGGAALAKLAEQGDPTRFCFPRPMVDRPGLDFSFSGLKTAALNTVHLQGRDAKTCADIARAFEDAVVETLVIKSLRAIKATGIHRLVVAGGVGANQSLRAALFARIFEQAGEVFFPRLEFCTDNGAMIAYVGCVRLNAGQYDTASLCVSPRWALDELSAIMPAEKHGK